jgi:tripartite-type tricarboxylate transporter receptor subunit TctC
VIENRAGAGGRVAADLLKASPADGSVVMITPIVVPVLAPLVFSKLNYNPATDFAPVGHVCNFNFALSVPASLPVKNVAEFVTWLKANPQKANFGSPAPGSLPHFFGEMLSRDAKADMVHVPFAGGSALMNALMGGQVSAGIDVLLEALEAHKSGKVRILATSGKTRSPLVPDVATFAEQGFPELTVEEWFGFYAPAKTPANVVQAANVAINAALKDKAVQDALTVVGLIPFGGTVADQLKSSQVELERWGPLIKRIGFSVDS